MSKRSVRNTETGLQITLENGVSVSIVPSSIPIREHEPVRLESAAAWVSVRGPEGDDFDLKEMGFADDPEWVLPNDLVILLARLAMVSFA